MPLNHPKYTVAVIQAASIWLDLCAGIDKTIALIKEAAKNGAKLVAFPETWLLVCGRDPWDVRSLTSAAARRSFGPLAAPGREHAFADSEMRHSRPSACERQESDR